MSKKNKIISLNVQNIRTKYFKSVHVKYDIQLKKISMFELKVKWLKDNYQVKSKRFQKKKKKRRTNQELNEYLGLLRWLANSFF